MMIKLADSHCHILDARLCNRAEEIVANLDKDGLDFIVEVSASVKESPESLAFAEAHDKVYCTIGVHPETVKDYNDDFENWAVKQKGNKKIVAVGECGLDYHYRPFDKELQKTVFTRQILLADKLCLPLVIHTRDAFDDTLEILIKNKNSIGNGLLLHCFSESAEEVGRVREHFDAYFAFGGAVTYKSEKSDGAIRAVGLDRMLLETDSPYLNPLSAGGKKIANEPKNVRYVANYISDLLNVSVEEVAEKTLANTKRLYVISPMLAPSRGRR